MKKLLMTALFLTAASAAFAAAQVQINPGEEAQAEARQAAYQKMLYNHPRTIAVRNSDLKVQITTDEVMHSCCRPPDLVVGGRVTNASGGPINYVHFLFAFEDEDGRVLHAESLYNHLAVSMADDEEIQRILKEKPHFTPLKPGETDTFSMSIPLPLLPKFAKVELFSNDARP